MQTTALRILTITACLGLLSSCGSDEPPPPEPNLDLTRETRAGTVVGFSDGEVSRWRGLPFAAAPVGNLRWRAPQLTPRWQGARQATEFGPICSQIGNQLSGGKDIVPGEIAGSEDCLYLNVVAPGDADKNELLPVMVWIHGGGNIVGAGSFYNFGLLAQRQRVVVVTLNYRLGLFGWLSHEALRQTAPDIMDASANFGLLDIISSLEWVRDNISVFGGDPTRVTIFGESAGGTDVNAMLGSRASTGLFHGAIAQSGSTQSFPVEQAEATEEAVDGLRGSGWFVRHWLQHEDALDAEGNPLPKPHPEDYGELVQWIRALDAEDIHKSSIWADEGQEPAQFPLMARVINDGLVIPSVGLTETFRQGRTQSVPAIFGTNRDEAKLFMAFDDEVVSNWLGIQYIIRDPARYERSSSYVSRMWKAYGADQPALHHAAPTWVYRFDWDEETKLLWTDFSQLLGAAHAFEIPFISGDMTDGPITSLIFNDENRAAARELSERMMAHWGTFARIGSPAAVDGSPLWPGYRIGHSFMVFDTTQDAGLHLRQGVISQQSLLEELATDAQVADEAERCDLAWGLFRTSAAPLPQNLQRYEQWQDGLCKEMPPKFGF